MASLYLGFYMSNRCATDNNFHIAVRFKWVQCIKPRGQQGGSSLATKCTEVVINVLGKDKDVQPPLPHTGERGIFRNGVN